MVADETEPDSFEITLTVPKAVCSFWAKMADRKKVSIEQRMVEQLMHEMFNVIDCMSPEYFAEQYGVLKEYTEWKKKGVQS